METFADTDLWECLDRLAAGDPAFLFTLTARHGARIAAAVAKTGVAPERVDLVVADVAFAMADRAGAGGWDAAGAPWDFVRAVLADVVGGPDAASPADASTNGLRSTRDGSGRVQPTRAVHLVDLENLAGGPWVERELVLRTWRSYQRIARTDAGDHVTVAAERQLWKQVAFDLDPGVRFLPGSGPDGADRALLGVADPDWIAERFDLLVVGSGDGAFSRLAADVAERDVRVVVVAVPGTLSRSLRQVAAEVRWFPRPGGGPTPRPMLQAA